MSQFRPRKTPSYNKAVSASNYLKTGGLSMVSRWKVKQAAPLLLSAMLAVTACSEPAAGPAGESPPADAKTADAKPAETAPAGGEAKADPFGKYETPVELTTVRQTDASFKFAEGESLDKNIWIPIFENQLGIRVKNLWVVDSSQYQAKLNIAIASGDLPDVMQVDKTGLQRLLDADMIEDLSEEYEKFASPFAKETMNKDGGAALAAATVGGKLMAIPKTQSNGGVSASEMIWVRTDWLQKLNLPAPKTMADVLKIAEAFAKQDPDGNGKADTVGLGINKDLYKGIGSLVGFFNGYHAYPNLWVEDGSGKLVYGSILPEMKTALQSLQDLYKNGMLDKELAVKPFKKIGEDALAGKLGLVYGGVATATGDLKETRKNDPNAQWQAYPIVSVDDKQALPSAGEPAEGFYVVRKGYKHPEAAFKLLNVYLKEFLDTPYAKGSDNPYAIDTKTNIFPAKFAPITLEAATHNLNAYYEVVEALKTGDGSKLGFPASLHFERNTNYRKGDQSMWFSDRTFGPEGSFSVIDHYFKNKQYKFDAYFGAATPTMVEKQATLQKMQDEIVTKIVMNAAPVSDYDNYIAEWKKLGGDKITQEVNDWYAKNKK